MPAAIEHTLLMGIQPLSNVWFDFVDYNFIRVADESDNFGQPKNFAVVQRDFRQRPASADPWNLAFRFRFARGGEGEEFDLQGTNGIVLRDNTDISKQTALSAGISYYHRAGHEREPPNLLNPFWRAGLVHADVDDQSRPGTGTDIQETLTGSGVEWAADAFNKLYNAGYRGIR
jgi:hypothetical protein